MNSLVQFFRLVNHYRSNVSKNGTFLLCIDPPMMPEIYKNWELPFQIMNRTQASTKQCFWVDEMIRDLKSNLGLTQVLTKDEEYLASSLMGFQIAYLILTLTGMHLPKRWQAHLAS